MHWCVFLQKLYLLNNGPLDVFLKLFDTQVQPMHSMGLNYGVLIKRRCIYIEKVHLYTLKRLLGIDMKTPNDLVCGETDSFRSRWTPPSDVFAIG